MTAGTGRDDTPTPNNPSGGDDITDCNWGVLTDSAYPTALNKRGFRSFLDDLFEKPEILR